MMTDRVTHRAQRVPRAPIRLAQSAAFSSKLDQTSVRPLREELPSVLPSLRARALKLCLGHTEAEDLVQDTVERALRFEQGFRQGLTCERGCTRSSSASS